MVFKLQSGHDFVTETDSYKFRGAPFKTYISKSYGSCDLHIVYCWLIFFDGP